MSISVDSVIVDVRDILQDIYADSYRWDDAVVLRQIDRAITRIFRDNPASRYSSPVAFAETHVAAAVDANLTLEPKWEDAIIHLTASFCFSLDESDKENERLAQKQMALYLESI